MPRSKEISENLRKQVVEAHKSGKGYKQISKALGLPKTTVGAILRKWRRFGTVVNLPRSGRPPKISVVTRREMIREVKNNPCMTSKDLQAALASANICVHQSTIRKILGIHRRPTLSSFEDHLQTSSPEDEGRPEGSPKLLGGSDEFSQHVKVEVEQCKLENHDCSIGEGGGSVEEDSFIETKIEEKDDDDDCHCNDGSSDSSSEKYIAGEDDTNSDSSVDDMYKYDDEGPCGVVRHGI